MLPAADFTEIWSLDGDKPVLGGKHVARVILRYFKGHGKSYQFDEARCACCWGRGWGGGGGGGEGGHGKT